MKDIVSVKSKVLEGLNAAQEQAVTFGAGPLLIIAGAGTGKTTVLTRRIMYLIEQGLATPDEILALTFTEKAAGEMNDRLDLLMDLGYKHVNISTFHAFAKQILEDYALDIGLPGDFKILNDTQAWILVSKHLSEFNLNYYKPLGNPTKFIHALLKHFERAKREGVTPENYLKYAQELRLATDSPIKLKRKKAKLPDALDPEEIKRIEEIAEAFHRYQKLILDLGFLDYNDLISYTIRLFRQRPKILDKLRAQYKYILVDEFQDTDLAQYELVKLLAAPKNNITVVGDDDQSIYKFRGASVSNIMKFEEDYPKLSKITLTDNYRSAQKILDLSYDFIQLNNPERLETKLKISKRLASHKESVGEIAVLHAENAYAEAVLVCDKIEELVAEQNLTYNDFAILARANDHADTFLAELSKRGMPYIFVANRGLYKKPFIVDLISYLKLLDNYHESQQVFRVLNFQKFRLPTEDLVNATHLAKKKGLSIYEILKDQPEGLRLSNEGKQQVQNFLTILGRHTKLAADAHTTALLLTILADLGITRDLAENGHERSEDIGLLRKFYGKAQEFESESDDKTLKGFLNLIETEQQAGSSGELSADPNAGPEAVKVLTIHAAKGLEFACVFVVNMVDARFPSRDRREQIELPQALANEIFSEGDVHLMEERRLFYVAATRAKDYLFLTWADDYGGSRAKQPSRFLLETHMAAPRAKTESAGQVKFTKPQMLPLPSIQKYPIPESFSWSSISTFLKCPLEYKYKYLYQLPLPGNAYASFGSSIHKAIQLFSQNVKQRANLRQGDLFAKPSAADAFEYPPLSALHKFYEQNWISDWYPNASEQENFKKRGYRLLENYYNRLTSQKLVPWEIEKFFRLKLGAYKYNGVIDCIFENANGSIAIVDYKTTLHPRTKLERVDKKQLLSYQLAAQEFFGRKVSSLCYWDLEDLANPIEFTGKPEEITEVREELLADIEQIVEAVNSDSFGDLDRHKSHDCQFRNFEN
ncbi:MAG TPA: ATP-dependent DNA helicase [Patescibacteria group bacterium]|nr:ATP-dependent DNA helicase [Patescibacteria group bacterium]